MPVTLILKGKTISEIITTKPDLAGGLNEIAARCRGLPAGVSLTEPGKYKVNRDNVLSSDLIRSYTQDSGEVNDEEIDLTTGGVKDYVLECVIKYMYQHNTDRDFWANSEFMPGTQKFTDGFKVAVIAKAPIYRFIYECDLEILYELTLAANYMDIKSLLVLTSNRIADMMIGKNHLEIRQIFGITGDFTPAEEAQILEENKCCN